MGNESSRPHRDRWRPSGGEVSVSPGSTSERGYGETRTSLRRFTGSGACGGLQASRAGCRPAELRGGEAGQMFPTPPRPENWGIRVRVGVRVAGGARLTYRSWDWGRLEGLESSFMFRSTVLVLVRTVKCWGRTSEGERTAHEW